MRRLAGAVAIFAGWMSFGIGALAGVVVSDGFGITHIEDTLAPTSVYGISGLVVLWIFVAAAIMTSLPLLMAVGAANPQRRLYVIAVAMAVPGVVLLGDELGRAFGLPILAGAACLYAAGRLLGADTATAAVQERAAGQALAPEPAVSKKAPAAKKATAPEPVPSGAIEAPAAVSSDPQPRKARKSTRGGTICPWCSERVPARTKICPSCKATLDGGRPDDAPPIPGVTEVDPGLREYLARSTAKKKRASIFSMMMANDSVPEDTVVLAPSDESALLPPSAAIKAEMARIDAEIAGGHVPADPQETPGSPDPA